MKKKIKINFADFWPDFIKTDNYFYNLLRQVYDVEISESPDFLFYSAFTNTHKKYKCLKIYYTGENRRPDFNECDYAFTFDYIDNPDHYRLPLYVMYDEPTKLIKPASFNAEDVLKEKTKFCNFVFSNGRDSAKKRTDFFHALSKYKRVDSGGKFLNNIGGPVKDKLAFIKDYKFTIAFENASYPGYTTEKIFQPMQVNSLPIYWGNELVDRDFNTKSFLNYHEFESMEALIEKVIELDKNDDHYIEYVKQPFYKNNTLNEFINPEKILKQFDYILKNEKVPVAQAKKKRFFFF